MCVLSKQELLPVSGAGMEPFGAEECHSSESGWTMYIGSSIDDAGGHSTDDGDGDDDNDDDDKEEGTQAHPQDDDESDDSMASDASSGPSHHHGFADFRRDSEEGNHDKYCFEKKASKTQHKQMEGEKVEKKGMLPVDSKDKSPVQGCGKVRKNYFVGKRK
ncbi:hypothetical protein D0Y65_011003 [Glycine soja]|nr:hypothetical protein D0Y65_011003 [Glycine soja]